MDSNHRPMPKKGIALPTELRAPLIKFNTTKFLSTPRSPSIRSGAIRGKSILFCGLAVCMLAQFENWCHRRTESGLTFLLTTSHIVKYLGYVHIVTRKHLSAAIKLYQNAANGIKALVSVVGAVRWHNFPEI